MTRQTTTDNLIDAQVAELAPELRSLRRSLHQYPEVGWTEFYTAARVCRTLHDLGYTIRTGRDVIPDDNRMGVPTAPELETAWNQAKNAGADMEWLTLMQGGFTGVVADLDTGKPGSLLALRFDMDALPIREARDEKHRPFAEDWASTRAGMMHACGHDGHTAIGMVLARLIIALKPHLTGRIRLIFQPAEEGVRGASAMTASVEGVDRLICLHLGLGVPSGEVVAGAIRFLATRELCAHFVGRAAHAGIEPEAGRSALLAASQAVLALHTLAQSGSDLWRVNAGVLHGGVATNVVPPEADLIYRIRADSNSALEALDARTRTAVISSAQTHGCQAEIEVTGQSVSEDSHPELAELVAEVARNMEAFRTVTLHREFRASEDATILMREVHRQGGQATYILLGSDLSAGHHNDRFDFDEASLASGLALLGRILCRISDI